jgi:prepilin-type N-terminal cleavage/methylation domain-containing protein
VRRWRKKAGEERHGLTLIELLVTLVIFIILAGFAIMAVRQVAAEWSLSERRRVLYERAAGVLDVMAGDIRLAVTLEPAGVTEVKARLIGDYEPGAGKQRLMFVRSFESGPERAITFNAGDGVRNEMMLKPAEAGGNTPQKTDAAQGNADGEDYTGLKVGDFKPLGGMAAIGYFTREQNLYRMIRAPVPAALSGLMDPASAQTLATDVLYLGFEYWGQNTSSWKETDKRLKTTGPEYVWDSTRSIALNGLKDFSLHRGADSAADTEDDVFPEKIRITVTVDSSMPRCVFTKLVDQMGESDLGRISVEGTKGFPDPDDQDPYLLIDGEWVRFKKRTADTFEISQRGARGTAPRAHAAKAVVRTGKTFRRVVYLPNWREDRMSDEQWRARKEAQKNSVRRLVQ